jgi:hypothetical protein
MNREIEINRCMIDQWFIKVKSYMALQPLDILEVVEVEFD